MSVCVSCKLHLCLDRPLISTVLLLNICIFYIKKYFWPAGFSWVPLNPLLRCGFQQRQIVNIHHIKSTHIVAVQIQNSDAGKAIIKFWHLSDQVPAQVHLAYVGKVLDALWHRGDPLEAEIQQPFTVLGQLHALLSRFQGDHFSFRCFGFLSRDHAAAGRWTSVVNS